MNRNSSQSSISRRWMLLLVAGALAIGWWLYRTGPVTERIEEKRPPKMVRTTSPIPLTHQIAVTAYGSVIPAREVLIEPQVSGHIIRLRPGLAPGGYVDEGEELFAIDPELAQLDLQQAVAELARAKAVLDEAQRKWDEGKRLALEQVIPETELASLESAVLIQEAELGRLAARQDRTEELLQRHVVRAPFNAVILEEAVEIGQRVNPGDATVTLVGTDEFWVRVSLPTDLLQWVRLPAADQPGAAAKVSLDTGEGQKTHYAGRVTQLLSDLDQVGRMARVLIQVEDPLQRKSSAVRPPLLLGSYVRVEIDAGQLESVLAIPRPALREGDCIWLADANGRLQIRPVNVRWRQDEMVYIDTALDPGETLIVSDLRVAMPGMEVKAQAAEESTPQPES